LTNLFLLTFLVTDYAYQFAYSLCTAAILICYLLVGIYQVQFSLKEGIKKQVVIGGIAVVFELMGIILAGFSYVLLCSIAYLPGFCFYWIACRETKHQITGKEKSNDWADLCGRTAFNRVACCRLDQDIRGKET
jgi:arginine:ornithine antiporter / lysine permease